MAVMEGTMEAVAGTSQGVVEAVEAPAAEGIKIPISATGKPVKPLGVAWYADEAGYEAVRALCGDMPDAPYQAWRAEAQDVFDGAHWGSKPRVEVVITAPALEAWCAKHRAVPNASARQRYVYEAVEKAFEAALKAHKAGKKPRRFLRF